MRLPARRVPRRRIRITERLERLGGGGGREVRHLRLLQHLRRRGRLRREIDAAADGVDARDVRGNLRLRLRRRLHLRQRLRLRRRLRLSLGFRRDEPPVVIQRGGAERVAVQDVVLRVGRVRRVPLGGVVVDAARKHSCVVVARAQRRRRRGRASSSSVVVPLEGGGDERLVFLVALRLGGRADRRRRTGWVSNPRAGVGEIRAKSAASRRSVRSALPVTHAKARGVDARGRAARPRVDGDGLSLVVERAHVVVHRVRAAEQAGDVERGDGGADEAHEDDEALARRSRARPRAPRAEAGDAAARGGGPAEGGASGGGARVRGLGRGGLRRAGTPVVLLVPPVDRPGRVVFRRRAGRSAGEGRGGRGGRRLRRDRRRPRRAARREGAPARRGGPADRGPGLLPTLLVAHRGPVVRRHRAGRAVALPKADGAS